MWIVSHNANELCITAHIKLINATKTCTVLFCYMQRKLYLLGYLGMDDILKYCSGWLHMEIKGE